MLNFSKIKEFFSSLLISQKIGEDGALALESRNPESGK